MAAYKHLGNNIFIGLAADTKPTAANTAKGALAIELDLATPTKFTFYVNDQTSWLPSTAFAETWTNKTLTSPTITTPAMSAPLTVANGGTGAGTLTGILKGNGTSAVTAAAQLAVADGGTGAGTLTGLLLGNGTSAFTTVTAPSGTVVGSTDSIELTNKTINAASNTIQSTTIHPGLKKTGDWMAIGSAVTCAGLMEGSQMVAITSGTAAHTGPQKSSAGTRYRYTTGGTGGSLVGHRGSSSFAIFERDLNPRIDIKLALGQATNERVAFGFHGTTSAPTAGTEPAANLHAVLFWLDTSVDANWHIAQNNGAATSDLTTINNVAAADANPHVFSLRADNANTKFQYAYGSTVPTSATTWTDINTKIPGATNGLNYAWWMENIGSNTDTFDVSWVHIEMDSP